MINKDELKSFIVKAKKLIEKNAVEGKLRSTLTTDLYKIFPNSPWWIQEHAMGTETYLKTKSNNGIEKRGFADSAVGKTAIEYEKNLNTQALFMHGYDQVKEYCAGLYNLGIPEKEILGILSDTVQWYGYSIKIVNRRNCEIDKNNIKLIQEDFVDLSNCTDNDIKKFELFVNKFLDRKQSRILKADSLTLEFGFESDFYLKEIGLFKKNIQNAAIMNPIYANLIQQVWQSFVGYLGVSDYKNFDLDSYTNEYYLVTVAKIICANILNGAPIISSDDEIIKILNGEYFKQNNIQNLVDYDYFGWLNAPPIVDEITASAKRIQEILSDFDFNTIVEKDLFGSLLAQLSSREHRLLLGQDFTPHWVARNMVDHVLKEINERPQVLDMCCGSGVFLIETIKKIRDIYAISPQNYDQQKDEIIFTCTMGFDIDPLAIMLSKVNWIMTMRDLFPYHKGQITIPIYHADSLFVATPITHNMPSKAQESYIMNFGASSVEIPAHLLTPTHRRTFDAFLSICYKYAMNRAEKKGDELTSEQLDLILNVIEKESGISPTKKERQEQKNAAKSLILQLESLQRQGKNGIWYFIINNSYKPSLVEKQFNCLISNPPWLAMSKLANNPYKDVLIKKVQIFGIKPPTASHPHMELATTFLLSSVDKYLKNGAKWMCVMPASILSGMNHEPFRLEKYREQNYSIDVKIDTIWDLPQNTFKNKAIVLGGIKSSNRNCYPLIGRVYDNSNSWEEKKYILSKQGNRSAWHFQSTNAPAQPNTISWDFHQGADIMPRTALFHTFIQQPNGSWTINKIEKTSELSYLLEDSHKNEGRDLTAEGFSNEYIFDCLISKHLSPFFVAKPAKIILPGKKDSGKWASLSNDDLALMDTGTRYVFNEIQDDCQETLPTLFKKINILNKLDKQVFSSARWIVLSNAGGTNPCAAYIDLKRADKERLIIDQTLYWYLAKTKKEAIYIVGMLNSPALAKAISDFQPEGAFGKRHIHTLPFKIIPPYNSSDTNQQKAVFAIKKLINEWNKKQQSKNKDLKALLSPNSGKLTVRRKKLQEEIKKLKAFKDYERICRVILNQ